MRSANTALISSSRVAKAQVRGIAPDGVDAVLHLAGDGARLAGLLRPP